jgi:hypothetical protein
MTGVRLPEEGGLVGTIFHPASFGNQLLTGLVVPNGIGRYFLSVGSIIALLPFLAPLFLRSRGFRIVAL